LPAAVAEAATAEAVVGSKGEASAVALSTVGVVSVGDISPVAVSTAVAFVATVLVITDSLIMSSSAASAFRAGGAGAIRTDITVTTITRTITMDTAGTHIMGTADTVTMVAPVMDIAMAADPGIPVLNIPAMRAIIIKEFGGLDSLVIENLPDPKPEKGHALIEVKAFGINHAETHMRSGRAQHCDGSLNKLTTNFTQCGSFA
jgi:hypothetical protein